MDTLGSNTRFSVETYIETIGAVTGAFVFASPGLAVRCCVTLHGLGVGTFSNLSMSASILVLATLQSGAGAIPLMYASTARSERVISHMTSRSAQWYWAQGAWFAPLLPRAAGRQLRIAPGVP